MRTCDLRVMRFLGGVDQAGFWLVKRFELVRVGPSSAQIGTRLVPATPALIRQGTARRLGRASAQRWSRRQRRPDETRRLGRPPNRAAENILEQGGLASALRSSLLCEPSVTTADDSHS